jgi:hypothetical protein
MKVRANAETPLDARTARGFGAEGIGLCRTEHMFFDEDRIVAMREMILADTEKDRRTALAKLLPMQRSDFLELFEIMGELPVTIRLLDPPLHEFLPHSEADFVELARVTGKNVAEVKARAEKLTETNPMLGHREDGRGVVVAVADPDYTFDPEVFPESAEARSLGRKLRLPPGPNNPVGTAWIGLDRPGYGIHGTPKPEDVGRTESHGCFRLANWNADLLRRMAWVGLPIRVEP